MKAAFQLYLFISTLLIFASCNNSTFEDQVFRDDGIEYVGLETGRYQIFQYDTISYKGTKRDTFSGYIKREIGESYIDLEQDTAYKVYISHSLYPTGPFKIHRVESLQIDENSLIESEEGLKFIKMIFPVSEGKSWLGNRLFDENQNIIEIVGGDEIPVIRGDNKWRYRIESVGNPSTSGEFEFENVLEILHVNEENFVTKRFVKEWYAQGIGLIKKQKQFLFSESNVSDSLVLSADQGYILDMRLIDYN